MTQRNLIEVLLVMLACSVCALVGGQELWFLSYHKSGTVVAMDMYDSIFFNRSVAVSQGQLLNYVKKVSKSDTCITPNVSFSPMGIRLEGNEYSNTVMSRTGGYGTSSAMKELSEALNSRRNISSNQKLHAELFDDYYVQIIRNPVDMLVSGYLYHFKCSEEWLLYGSNSAQVPSGRINFPPHFKVSGSYCKWLQSESAEKGIRKEVERAAGVKNGPMTMIEEYLQLQGKPNVLHICLPEINDLLPQLKKFLSPWNPYDHELTIGRMTQHYSNHTHEQELMSIAIRAAADFFTEHQMTALPCASQLLPKSEMQDLFAAVYRRKRHSA